ncbi:hypothetical protein pb186bvf_001100 [Paramecium bursaria]
MITIAKSQRLNKRLQVQNIVREIYLSDDIPCQLGVCKHCQNEGEQFEEQYIYLVDTEILESYIDLIEQSQIKNIIILQSQYNYFRKRSQQVINLIDSNFSKICYIYQDEFSKITQQDNKLINLAIWYNKHIKLIKSNQNVRLLTQNYDTFQLAEQNQLDVYTIQDYVKRYEQSEDLLDFLGMEIEIDQTQEYYPKHFSIEECVQKIKQGLLFEGRLCVDRNDIKLAKISVRQFNFDIRIVGLQDQNRSLNGDRVAVQLLPEQFWLDNNKVKEFNIQDEEDDDINETKDDSKLMEISSLQSLFKRIKENNLTPQGQVVGILQRTDKQYCGHVVNNLFYPADGRYNTFILLHPRLNLVQDKKILVQFTDWPSTSQYPLCKLKKVLGQAGDSYVEGNVILLEHQVEIREFSHQVIACLPLSGEKYNIPQDEINRRWDLRDILICSIDPIGCKDIDDALHCRFIDGYYEVGVHIADVSYFVKPDTAIDKEAAHRCTTVYLVDRRTDMLPKLLTENLCSLVSNVDRQAFSVIWKMDENANIIDVKFGKSIIRSCASLNYGQAQEMIDNQNDHTPLTQGIRFLNQLAKKLKQQRIDAGALTLASNQVSFTFDAETHNPTDVRMYKMYDTNSLVEEFMLLANVSVAEKILSRFPAISILRRHQQPKVKQIKELRELLNKIGYQFEYDTSKQLNDSLNLINRNNDPFFNKLVRMMTTRCMNEALYVCTADVDYTELHHYGLAADLYTHFTSPIRRYADVLVHRLLSAAIDLESLPSSMSNKIKMSRICDKMNMRHRYARFASRASSDYHTYLFFKNQKEQIQQAIITGITEKAVSVLLPRYGLEGFIDSVQNEDKISANIQGQNFRIFDYIKVKVEVELKNFHKKIHLQFVNEL